MQSILELESGKRKASLQSLVNILKVLFPLQYKVLFSQRQARQNLLGTVLEMWELGRVRV